MTSDSHPTSKDESPVVFNLRQIAASDIARWDIRNHIAAAADEIERLTRELQASRLRADALLEAECDKCPAVTERDRLRAALVKHGTHATGCANQRNVGECSCGLWAALSGEPNSAPETTALRGPPVRVRYLDSDIPDEPVRQWARLSGGDFPGYYLVLVGELPNVESLWFDAGGVHPKSVLFFGTSPSKASERSACKSCDHVPAPGQSLLASGNCLVCEAL